MKLIYCYDTILYCTVTDGDVEILQYFECSSFSQRLVARGKSSECDIGTLGAF